MGNEINNKIFMDLIREIQADANNRLDGLIMLVGLRDYPAVLNDQLLI